MDNPFAGVGQPVTGDRFIGRNKEIKIINDRLFGKNSGNLSIVGLQRVGKTSLVHHVLELKKDDLPTEFIVVKITVETGFSSLQILLNIILKDVQSQAIQKVPPHQLAMLEEIISEIGKCGNDIERRESIISYLKKIKLLKFRVICVLDEFDRVLDFADTSHFEFFRELGSTPDYGISWVIISHRSIYHIEESVKNPGKKGPYWFNTFAEIPLALYNRKEMSQYWTHFWSGNVLSDDDKNTIVKAIGNHPFFLDEFNYSLWYEIEDFATILEAIISTQEQIRLFDHYTKILTLLESLPLNKQLLQAVEISLDYENITTIDDINRLRRYGLIVENNQKRIIINSFQREVNGYDLFSEDFLLHLRNYKPQY